LSGSPLLSTIVVAWRSRDDVLALAAAFPASPRHELVVVDNGGELSEGDLAAVSHATIRLLRPGRNLGFAGGSNLGARTARAERLLFLNPDSLPVGEAFDEVAAAFDRWPRTAGIVPWLIGEAGESQHRWQLRELPSPLALLAHAFFWEPRRGDAEPPPGGSLIGQPAAAALALRREDFERLDGFDERFAPAWFEDIDLARRLADIGAELRFLPEAVFRHRSGSSVGALGYGRFLAIYDRNLALYLRLHHGASWALAFRLLVPIGALARLIVLPLRRPRRASTRPAAARALVGAARAALRNWPPDEISA